MVWLLVMLTLVVRNFDGAWLAFFRLLAEPWKSAVKW
jgi:hypothetical protein